MKRQRIAAVEDGRLRDVRKAIVHPPEDPWITLQIIGGNSLGSGQDGIKWVSGSATALPADYDPQTDTSFADGWGIAYLYLDGVQQFLEDGTTPKRVLFINDGNGGFTQTLVEGWQVYSTGPVYLDGYNGDPPKVEVYVGFVL